MRGMSAGAPPLKKKFLQAMRAEDHALTLLALPADLLLRVLGEVNHTNLLVVGATCTALHALAGDGQLWRQQLRTRYQSVIDAVFDGMCPSPPPSAVLASALALESATVTATAAATATATATATETMATATATTVAPLHSRCAIAPSPWRAHFFAFAGTWMLHARAAGRVVLLLDGEAFELTGEAPARAPAWAPAWAPA